MNNPLQAYNIMASPTPDDTPQQSTNSVHTHLFYNVAQEKQAGGLAGFNVRTSPSLRGSALSLALTNTKSVVWTLCNVLHWLIQTMAILTSS